jgi:hypothetical protein
VAAVQELVSLALLCFLVPSTYTRRSVLPPGYWELVAGYRISPGGLLAILSGSVLLLELVASKLRARFSQISSFCYCVEDNASAGLLSKLRAGGPPPSSAANLRNKDAIFSAVPLLNGHRGNFVFFINEIRSLYLT